MISFRAAAQGGANNTSAQITVPATCQTGDVIIISLSLNSTDVITSAPAALILLNSNALAPAAFPNRLYSGIVDGASISPGTVLTWALSATRSWTANLYAAAGVNTQSPVRNYWASGSSGSTVTVTYGFPAATSWLLEIGSAKSNGTSITSWTSPSGWTIQSSASANTSTSQGSSFIADYNSGLVPAGTYGGDIYTPNATPSGVVTYVVALNPDPYPPALFGPSLLTQNNAEGGTNNTAVSTANSGGSSGTAWDIVTTTNAATVTYSTSVAAHGTLSYKFTTSSTAGQGYVTWRGAITATLKTFYFRTYLYLPAYPPSTVRVFEFQNSSLSKMAAVNLSTAGKLTIKDATDTTIASGSTVIPLGQWVRIEFRCVSDATNGQTELLLYTIPDSSTYAERQATTSSNTNGANLYQVLVGLAGLNSTSYTYYQDDIALSGDTYIGAVPGTVAAIAWTSA